MSDTIQGDFRFILLNFAIFIMVRYNFFMVRIFPLEVFAEHNTQEIGKNLPSM